MAGMSRIRTLALGLVLVSLAVSMRATLSVSDESRLQHLVGQWKVTESEGSAVEAGKKSLAATEVSAGVIHLVWTYGEGSASYQRQALIRYDTKTRALQLLELNRSGRIDIFPGQFARAHDLVFEVRRGITPARLSFTWTGDTLTARESFYDAGALHNFYVLQMERAQP